MEPRKITGGTVDLGDGQPLVDVDTAVLALHDELTRIGRRRDAAALAALVNVTTQANAREARPWIVREQKGGVQREIEHYNYETHVILLAPMETLDEGDPDGGHPDESS